MQFAPTSTTDSQVRPKPGQVPAQRPTKAAHAAGTSAAGCLIAAFSLDALKAATRRPSSSLDTLSNVAGLAFPELGVNVPPNRSAPDESAETRLLAWVVKSSR